MKTWVLSSKAFLEIVCRISNGSCAVEYLIGGRLQNVFRRAIMCLIRISLRSYYTAKLTPSSNSRQPGNRLLCGRTAAAKIGSIEDAFPDVAVPLGLAPFPPKADMMISPIPPSPVEVEAADALPGGAPGEPVTVADAEL